MGNKLRKVGGVAGATLLSAAALLASAPPVMADTGAGSGSGGCGGPCTVYGPFSWKVTGTDERGSAFSKFAGAAAGNTVGLSGVRHDTLVGYFNGSTITPTNNETSAQLLDRCVKSDYIWWVTGVNNPIDSKRQPMFTPNYGGTMTNTIPTAKVLGMKTTSVPSDVKQSITQWISDKDAGAMRIICSYGVVDSRPPAPKPIIQKTTETQKRPNKAGRTGSWSEPHSYLSTITLGLKEDFVGERNLHDQPLTQKKTAYGTVVDNIRLGLYQGKTFDEVSKAVNDAIAADKKAGKQHSLVNLDGKNKQGMAEGGVLNVNEQTKHAAVSISESIPVTATRTKIVRQDPVWDATAEVWRFGPPVTSYTKWVETQGDPSTQLKSTLGSLQNTGFWQMISAHCNETGFANLLKSNPGSTLVQQGDERIASVAYSKKFAQRPSQVPFGDPNTDSGKVSFYDKECGFTCTKDPDTTNPAPKIVEKTGARAYKKDPGTGAITPGELASNKFIFFRDNLDHPFRVDVWRPQRSTGLRNVGAASTTTVTRWLKGTPGLTPGENGNGGQFSLSTTKGEPVFDAKETKIPTQRNFDGPSALYKTNVAGKLAGEVRDFNIKGTWASDEGRPEAFNLKWEFRPEVSTTVPATGLGFDNSGNPVAGTPAVVWTGIEGRCVAEFGKTKSSFDYTGLVERSTGTGTTNTLDSELLQGFNDDYKSYDGKITTNLLVKFVRATTE